jgi:tetratricopeptide (TPR) repeat protein
VALETFSRAIEAMKRWVKVHPDDTRGWTMGAPVLADMGEPDRAASCVGRAVAIDRDEAIIQYNAACVFVALGRIDDAIAALEVAARVGVIAKDWMKNDPDLDLVRGDPPVRGARRSAAGLIRSDAALRRSCFALPSPLSHPVAHCPAGEDAGPTIPGGRRPCHHRACYARIR